MFRIGLMFTVALIAALLAGCAGSGGDLASVGGSSQVVGDENGGKIANALGSRSEQTATYQQVTTYCEKFGKKGIITNMDYDTGQVTFVCRLLKGRSAG